jgi:hypothetical protein
MDARGNFHAEDPQTRPYQPITVPEGGRARFLEGDWRGLTAEQEAEYLAAEEQGNRQRAAVPLPIAPGVPIIGDMEMPAWAEAHRQNIASGVLGTAATIQRAGLTAEDSLIFGRLGNADELHRLQSAAGQNADLYARNSTLPGPLKTANRYLAKATGTLAKVIPLAAATGPVGVIVDAALERSSQAVQEGRDAGLEGWKLANYAVTSGGIEGGVTALFQGINKLIPGFGGLENIMSKPVEQTTKQLLVRMGLGFAGELAEEESITVLDAFNQTAQGVDPQAWENVGEAMKETGFVTLATMGLANTPKLVGLGRDAVKRWADRNPDLAQAVAALPDNPSRKQMADAGVTGPSTAQERADLVKETRTALAAVEEAPALENESLPVAEVAPEETAVEQPTEPTLATETEVPSFEPTAVEAPTPEPPLNRTVEAGVKLRYKEASGRDLGEFVDPSPEHADAIEFMRSRGKKLRFFTNSTPDVAPGFHDPITDTTYLHASQQGDALWYAVGHEYAHASGWDERLSDLPADIIDEAKADYWKGAAPKYREKLAADEQLFKQEAVAKYMGNFLKSAENRAKLKAENPTLWQKIVNAIKKLIGSPKTKADLRVLEAFRDGVGKPSATLRDLAQPSASSPTTDKPTTNRRQPNETGPDFYAPSKRGTSEATRSFEESQDAARIQAGPKNTQDERLSAAREEAKRRIKENPQAVADEIAARAARGEGIDAATTLAYGDLIEQAHKRFVETGDAADFAKAQELFNAYRETGTAWSDAGKARYDALSEPERRRAAAIELMMIEPRRYAAKLKEARDAVKQARDDLRKLGEEPPPPMLMDAVKLADSSTAEQTTEKPKRANPRKLTARRKLTEAEKALKSLQKRIADENKTIFDKLQTLGHDVGNLKDIADNPRKFNAFVRDLNALKGGMNDVLYEYYRSWGLMSGIPTQSANVFGAWADMLKSSATWAVEAGINTTTGKRANAATLGELPFIMAGLKGLWGKAKYNAAQTFKNEMSEFQFTHGEESDLRKFDQGAASTGKAGKLNRLWFRIASAADDWNKTVRGELAVGMFAYRLAKQEGLEGADIAKYVADQTGNPTSEAWKLAVQAAERGTVSDKGGKVTQALSRGAKVVRDDIRLAAWDKGGAILGVPAEALRYLIPFVHTPLRALSRGLERSYLDTPGLFLDMGKKLANRKDPFEGNEARLARQAVAYMLGYAIASGVGDSDDEDTWITGTDEKHPFSVKIGGRWFSYARIDPLATALGVTVDGIKKIKEGNLKGVALQPFVSLYNMTKEKSMLDAMGDLFRIMEAVPASYKDGSTDRLESEATKLGTNWAAGWVPNLIRNSVRATEADKPLSKNWGSTIDPDQWANRAKDRLLQRMEVPAALGMVDDTPQVGLFGERRQQTLSSRPALDTGLRLFLPTKADQVLADVHPGYRFMQKWNENAPPGEEFGDMELKPTFISKGQKVSLTDKEYTRYAELAGENVAKAWKSAGFNADKPTAGQAAALRAIIGKARENAKERILAERGITTGLSPKALDTSLMRSERLETLGRNLSRSYSPKTDGTLPEFQAKRAKWLEERKFWIGKG